MKKLFGTVPVILMLVCLNAGWASATLLQNGEFSSGFDHWTGFVNGNIPVNTISPNFDASAGAAILINDDTNYQVLLSQIFELPAISSTLTFDYLWVPTDKDSDTFQASFAVWNSILSVFDSPIDLFSGPNPLAGSLTTLAYDMTPYAGQTIRLDFILTDNDFAAFDMLVLDNVMTTAPVPEPGTLLTLCAGLSVLLLFSRRGSQNKTL